MTDYRWSKASWLRTDRSAIHYDNTNSIFRICFLFQRTLVVSFGQTMKAAKNIQEIETVAMALLVSITAIHKMNGLYDNLYEEVWFVCHLNLLLRLFRNKNFGVSRILRITSTVCFGPFSALRNQCGTYGRNIPTECSSRNENRLNFSSPLFVFWSSTGHFIDSIDSYSVHSLSVDSLIVITCRHWNISQIFGFAAFKPEQHMHRRKYVQRCLHSSIISRLRDP